MNVSEYPLDTQHHNVKINGVSKTMATYEVRYSDLKRSRLVRAGNRSAAIKKAEADKPGKRVISARKVSR